MRQELNLLSVSGCRENKKTLLSIIAGLPLNVYTTGKIKQAWEVL